MQNIICIIIQKNMNNVKQAETASLETKKP